MPDERAPYRFAVLHHAATGKHFLIPGPTDVAAAGPDVVEHLGKQWTDLSESEGNKVAREVGLLAHRILHADLTDTKKSLH